MNVMSTTRESQEACPASRRFYGLYVIASETRRCNVSFTVPFLKVAPSAVSRKQWSSSAGRGCQPLWNGGHCDTSVVSVRSPLVSPSARYHWMLERIILEIVAPYSRTKYFRGTDTISLSSRTVSDVAKMRRSQLDEHSLPHTTGDFAIRSRIALPASSRKIRSFDISSTQR